MLTKQIFKLKYLDQWAASRQANAPCECLSLPIYAELKAKQQEYVVEKVGEFYRNGD